MIVAEFTNSCGSVVWKYSGWTDIIEYNDEALDSVFSENAQMWFNFYVQELKMQEIEERVNRLYEMFKEQEKE